MYYIYNVFNIYYILICFIYIYIHNELFLEIKARHNIYIYIYIYISPIISCTYMHMYFIYIYEIIGDSLMAQWVKNLPAMQETKETQVLFLAWEDPLGKEMTTHSSILA